MAEQNTPYLSEFHAHSVWGKYAFELKLVDGVNFISGLNGSSKSTLLYLIYGSFAPEVPMEHVGAFASRSCLSDDCRYTCARFTLLDEVQYKSIVQMSDKLDREQKAGNDIIGCEFQTEPFSVDFLNKMTRSSTTSIKPSLHSNEQIKYGGVFCTTLQKKGMLYDEQNQYELPNIRIISPIINKSTLKTKERNSEVKKRQHYSEIYGLLYETVDRFLAYEYGLFEQFMEHIDQKEQIFAKRRQFENLVNDFFNETGKKLIRNEAKELAFSMIDDNQTLEVIALSHGEKSLLYMLLTVFLEHEKVRIFLFDEPETALHLSWQKKLPEALMTLAPKCQFILTTHSPGIVSGKWLPRLVDMAQIRTSMVEPQ